MKYYHIKFGFNNDDFISIDETELARAIIAQTTGKVGIFKEGTITGDKIISITPDINKLMGWNRTYQPTSEDYGEIPEKILNEHRKFLEDTRLQIVGGSKPELDKPQNRPFSNEVESLANKFKI